MKGKATLCIAAAIALATAGAMAQVSVNAPGGLNSRSVTHRSEPAKVEPQKKESAAKEAKHEPQASKHQAEQHQSRAAEHRREHATTQHHGSSATESYYYGSTPARPQVRTSSVSGFRIQAYTGNNAASAKRIAAQRARAIAMKFPQYRAYITYKAPAWRLRLGDFTSLSQAQQVAKQMRKLFPKLPFAVVRDRVNIWK